MPDVAMTLKELFKAISAAEGWEAPVPDQEEQFARNYFRHWRDTLLDQSGKSWAKRQAVYHVAGDKLGTGYRMMLDIQIYCMLMWCSALTSMNRLHWRLTPTHHHHCIGRPKMLS